MRPTRSIVASALFTLLAIGTAVAAPGGMNTSPITIPDNANALQYPSTIALTGPLPITNIQVVLKGLTHGRLADLTVLLVSPSGKKIELMAGAPGTANSATDVTFSEAGRALNGEPVTSETAYRPTVIPGPAEMPAPAPPLPYESSFASLIGTDAGGTWSLYVRDNVAGAAGSIAGGWAIGLNGPSNVPLSSEFTYQGRASDAGGPINGVRDIQLRLFDSPISTAQESLKGTAEALGVTVQGGLFNARFSPQSVVFSKEVQIWAEVGVRLPGGPSYTALSPRQEMTAAPFATLASRAVSAGTADFASDVNWLDITGVPANVLNAFSPWASVNGNSINNTNTGNVLIGTSTGASKLTVNGVIESQSGGIKFPDHSVQTTAAAPASVILSGTVGIDLAPLDPGSEVICSAGLIGNEPALTDCVVISPQMNLASGLVISWAGVSGDQTHYVKFVVRNVSAGAVDAPYTIFNIKVIR